MIYLLYSFFFFIFGFIISSLYNVKQNYYFLFFFAIVLFWGLSYIYAIDTDGYMAKFYYDIQTLGGYIDRQFEIGYTFSAMILKSITPHYWFYQLIIFGIEVLLIIGGLRKFFDDKEMMYIIPLLFFIYPINLAAFRQGMSISIFIYALHYIFDDSIKKSLLYFFFIFIASLFHQSTLLLVLVYLSRYTKTLMSKNWLIILILGIADVLWLTGSTINSQFDFLLPLFYGDTLGMGDKYAMYIETEEVGANYGIAKVLEINVTVILYAIFCKKDWKNELLRFNMMIYVFIGLCVGGMLAHRLNYYWILIYYVCFIQSIISMFKTIRMKSFAYILIALYMLWFYIFKGNLISHNYIFLFNG